MRSCFRKIKAITKLGDSLPSNFGNAPRFNTTVFVFKMFCLFTIWFYNEVMRCFWMLIITFFGLKRTFMDENFGFKQLWCFLFWKGFYKSKFCCSNRFKKMYYYYNVFIQTITMSRRHLFSSLYSPMCDQHFLTQARQEKNCQNVLFLY